MDLFLNASTNGGNKGTVLLAKADTESEQEAGSWENLHLPYLLPKSAPSRGD